MRILNLVASILFIVCIPVLLVTSNARGAINTIRLHEYSYDRYGAVTITGIEKTELLDIAEGLTAYFNSGEELSVADFFNEREVMHLADVKNLIRLFYRIQEATLIYVILYIIFGFVLCKRKWWERLGNGLIWGSGLTLTIFATVGIALAADFDELFNWFHEVSFSNKLWLMLPSDLLTQLYPDAFFFTASLFVVIATIVECLLLGGLSFWYIRR
ncbi:TIGR01906 family membrane protein [Chloroflexota bacterium]